MLGSLLVLLLLQPAPNHRPMPDAFPSWDGLNGALAADHLPLAFAHQVSRRLDVRLHRVSDWAMAFYLPAPPPPPAAGDDAPPPRPLLFLYEPHYLDDGRAIPLGNMPVDAAEYLLHALLEAYLDLEVVGTEGEYGTIVAQRSATLLPEIVAEVAQETYAEAVASFGSHVLSLANEMDRKAASRGTTQLCRALRQGVTLFRFWEQAFEGGEFTARTVLPAPGNTTELTLETLDKELFLRHVLDDAWTGHARIDFGRRFCGGDERDPGSGSWHN